MVLFEFLKKVLSSMFQIQLYVFFNAVSTMDLITLAWELCFITFLD